MLTRIVRNIRRKLMSTNFKKSATFRIKSSKSSKINWSHLLDIHNDRKLTTLREIDQIRYIDVTDSNEVSHLMLCVTGICCSATIEDIANIFPDAGLIMMEKRSSRRSGDRQKLAYVGYQSESDCVNAFLDCEQIDIRGSPIVVTFADIAIDKVKLNRGKKSKGEKCENGKKPSTKSSHTSDMSTSKCLVHGIPTIGPSKSKDGSSHGRLSASSSSSVSKKS